MRPTLIMTTLLICALSFTTTRAQNTSQKIVQDGIEIEFSIDPANAKSGDLMAGQDAIFRFKIRDTTTHTPVTNARPAAWIAQREQPGPLGPEQCHAKVEAFLQGSMRSRPDVDLNTFYLLALNEEPNISVIDPLVGFGGTKLLTLILLKSPGEDWALTADRRKLFVSMPRANQVAVVDTATWKVVANVDAGNNPTRVGLQPDEKYLWVTNDAGVTVVDATTFKVAKQIYTDAGPHEIAFGANNKFAFVSNRDNGTLSVIDIPKLSKRKDIKTGAHASSMAFSALSKAIYVTSDVDGRIAVVDAESLKLVTAIDARPGLKTLRFARGGRWGFVANPAASMVHIFDASTNRLVHEQAVGEAPDQFAFTDNFAYVRSLGSDQVSAIRLATVGGKLDMVKFPGGQLAPGEETAFASSADALVPAPEPNAMIFANPADRMIYYYSEGMAAPMGNFQNYRRVPRAVKIIDRSLREESSGVYSTTARLPRHGVYNVPLALGSPRVVHCFEASAKLNPAIEDDERVALRIEYLTREPSLSTGTEHKVRFRLIDTKTSRPNSTLKDVGVLVFLPPGTWQQRQIARPLGDGVYEVTVNLPESGVYLLFVESPSQKVQYRELPYLTLHANAAADERR